MNKKHRLPITLGPMILSFCTLLCFPRSSFSETLLVRLEISLAEGKERFEKSRPTVEWYEQVRSDHRVVTSLHMTSKDRGTKEKIETFDADYVAGRDDGGRGFSWLKMVFKDGKPKLELKSEVVRLLQPTPESINRFPSREMDFSKMKEGVDFEIMKSSAIYDLEFVEGSMKDWQDSKEVKLRLTKEGLKSFITDLRTRIEDDVRQTLLSLRSLESNKEPTIRIEEKKSKEARDLQNSQGLLVGNQDRLEVLWPSVTFLVDAKVE